MKNFKTYAGITITTLALPLISHITGLSDSYSRNQINQERLAHYKEALKQGIENKYERHYQQNKNIYHVSAKTGFTGLLALIGFSSAINFINQRKGSKIIFNEKSKSSGNRKGLF